MAGGYDLGLRAAVLVVCLSFESAAACEMKDQLDIDMRPTVAISTMLVKIQKPSMFKWPRALK